LIKIVHVITGLGGGGAERMLVRVATKSDRKHFETLVVSMTDDGVQGSALREHGVRVVALGMQRGVPDIRGLIRLRRLLVRERPNIVQTWLYHADLLGLIAAKLAGVSIIGWNVRCSKMEMQHYRRLTPIVRGTLSIASRFASFVIVNSLSGKAFHESLGYRPSRWELIYNGFDLDEFRPDPEARVSVRRELGAPQDAKLIGMTARFDPMKDFTTFFRAAAIMNKDAPETHYLLAGPGVDPENGSLSACIHEELKGRVHLLGFRSDVRRLTAACDVFTLVSRGEGFPNVVGEAMSCGVPCVATDVGDVAFLIGQTGRVVPVEDASGLAAAWRKILDLNIADRNALGWQARQRIREHFDLKAIVGRYEQTYLNMVMSNAI